MKESIRTFVILSLIGGGDDWFNTVAISKDDLDDTKRDSLEGRPVYQFSGDVPERISLYDGLSQEQFQKHCFENLNNDNKFSKLIADIDDLSEQDIEKIRTFISKYIEITNKADALAIRELQTENLNKRERREIFENEFGINYNNIDKEMGKLVDEIREASDDLPLKAPKLRSLDVDSEHRIFTYLLKFYTYITLKSKYSSSSKTLKNKPELLKDIENFSNAYFNRTVRYMHAKDTHIDDDHKKEIREHILSAVMAFVISEDRLPTSNEEIMSTLFLSMPFNDLERIAIDLQKYSMLTNAFSGIEFSKNDFEKNLICLSPTFTIISRDFDEHYLDEAYMHGAPMYKHLISSYSCQYIDIKYKGGMITATSPGWDNKIGSKDDIIIFEYEGDKILSYISEFKEFLVKKKIANDNDSNTGAADVKAIAAPGPIQAAPTIQAAPSPAPTPNNIASDTEKRCDTQTISKEKHLPKWNIEIVDSSVITSMLKDAEKNHLPFLKINASDNLKQKLETYINKEPSKLHENSQNTFTCEPANYIRTASNIGIQLVLCNDNDDEMSVAFLNLVSPVDNKARVYTAKTFDHLFKDAPVIDITEETVINGERAAYIAVKYETYSDGTGHERSETDIVHYLFLGDKLRFLSDWNAFHIVEDWYYYDDGTEICDCDAKATVLRIESTGAKHQEHTFSISTSN